MRSPSTHAYLQATHPKRVHDAAYAACVYLAPLHIELSPLWGLRCRYTRVAAANRPACRTVPRT